MSSPNSTESMDVEKVESFVSDASDQANAIDVTQGNSKETNSSIPHNSKNSKWKNGKANTSQPCNCVVLKNLDFNISKNTLSEIVGSLLEGHSKFTSISLAGDKASGTFRGVAFVTFASVKEASIALKVLSKVAINQRKVVAEYRRMRGNDRKDAIVHDKRHKKGDHFASQHGNTPSSAKYGEFCKTEEPAADDISGSSIGAAVDKRAQFFASRDTGRRTEANRRQDEKKFLSERDKLREAEFRKILIRFANGALRTEEGENNQSLSSLTENVQETNVRDMVFDSTLTSYERQMVHMICDELQLGHISRTDDDGNRNLHVTRDPERAAEWAREEGTSSQTHGKSRGARSRHNTRIGVSDFFQEDLSSRRNYFRPRAALAADGSADLSGGLLPPSYRVYTPKRQPSGPDGTTGFHSRRRHHNLDVTVSADKNKNLVTDQEVHNSGKGSATGNAKTISGAKHTGNKGKNGKNRKASVLNPSVPAFSPVNGSQ